MDGKNYRLTAVPFRPGEKLAAVALHHAPALDCCLLIDCSDKSSFSATRLSVVILIRNAYKEINCWTQNLIGRKTDLLAVKGVGLLLRNSLNLLKLRQGAESCGADKISQQPTLMMLVVFSKERKLCFWDSLAS